MPSLVYNTFQKIIRIQKRIKISLWLHKYPLHGIIFAALQHCAQVTSEFLLPATPDMS